MKETKNSMMVIESESCPAVSNVTIKRWKYCEKSTLIKKISMYMTFLL